MGNDDFIDLRELLRTAPASPVYGALGPSRLDPVEHYPDYAELPPEARVLVDGVRNGTPRSAVLLWRGRLWCFECRPSGRCEGGKQYGYTVRSAPLPLAQAPRRVWPGRLFAFVAALGVLLVCGVLVEIRWPGLLRKLVRSTVSAIETFDSSTRKERFHAPR